MNLPGIKILETNGQLILKRAPHFCFMQNLIDTGCIFFSISVVYVVLNQNPIEPAFLAMTAGAFVWWLYYLRRMVHSMVGEVKFSAEGIQWKNTLPSGWTYSKHIPWSEIETVFTRHETPSGRGRATTGFSLKIRAKNEKRWTLLQAVADYKTATQTCYDLDNILRNHAQGKLVE